MLFGRCRRRGARARYKRYSRCVATWRHGAPQQQQKKAPAVGDLPGLSMP